MEEGKIIGIAGGGPLETVCASRDGKKGKGAQHRSIRVSSCQ